MRTLILLLTLTTGCAHHQLHAYPLLYEDAASAAATVQALDSRGVRAVVPVARTNMLLVEATPTGQERTKDLLLTLDVDAGIDEGPELLVIYLLEHRSETLTPTLQGLWDPSELRLEADARANAIIARGDRATLRQLRTVVDRLDVPEEALVPPEVEESATIE